MSGEPLIRVEGKIVGRWVGELRRAALTALAGPERVAVDLGGVSFADTDGIALLRELSGAGVTFVNGSAFVAAQLGSPDDV